MKPTLSVVISAYNEEAKITGALESVKEFADEIIVVDNSSTDKTAAIAKKYTKKVFTQKNNPLDIDRQKNFGFSKATKEWTLSLDADERVTPELATEIKETIENWKLKNENSDVVGYWIPRRNIIFGKWIQHTGWYPDHQLRLFKTGKGRFIHEHYHEDIEIDGEKAYLHTDILHEHVDSVNQFISRNLLSYAKNEAKAKIGNGYSFSYLDALWFPAREFLSRFFAREGYKDGLHGLVLSLLMAAYHLFVFTYIWEEKEFPQQSISIGELEKTTKKIGKETTYWFVSTQINEEKNPMKKTMLKIKRKTI